MVRIGGEALGRGERNVGDVNGSVAIGWAAREPAFAAPVALPCPVVGSPECGDGAGARPMWTKLSTSARKPDTGQSGPC